jgi:2-phospho-L-lactate guanylyltransferase
MPLSVVIPVKRFEAAKTRLSSVLSLEERASLAHGLFLQALRAASGCSQVNAVFVVTNSDDVKRRAVHEGATALSDPATNGSLAEIIEAGVDEAARRGAQGAIVLMSDLPLVESRDVSELAVALEHHDVAIAPDRHRTNTNALAISVARRPALAFGSERSFEKHVSSARALGQTIHVLENERLAFDVDVPADYARLSRLENR